MLEVTGLDEISFKLGKIMSEIDGLKDDVRDVKREVSEDRKATDKFREEIKVKVKSIGEAVDEISPHVEDYRTLRQKRSRCHSGQHHRIRRGLSNLARIINFWPVIRDTLKQALK
ncbi:MAG: hypothetical protein IPK23_14840 [Rhizobiales bacterium]|nr:hypothetical protein [Hyphomicrobiales bacterium]